MLAQVLVALAVCLVIRGQAPCVPAGDTDSALEAQIQSVFNGGDNCVCVPYYLCVNNSIVVDGTNLIDIRLSKGSGSTDKHAACSTAVRGSCATAVEVWCNTPNVIVPNNECQGPGEGRPVPYERVESKGCGQRNPQGVGFRITGQSDNEAQFGEFPWMMAILVTSAVNSGGPPANVYLCGGSLIHPQVVLTAAHCVASKVATELKVRAGEWDTQTVKEIVPHQDRGVRKIIKHERYYGGALHNDIALLVLDSPLAADENVGTICLPDQETEFDQSNCVASGWGKDIFGREGLYQVILKSIELPMVPHDTCEENLRNTRLGKYFQLHNSFVCAGGEEGKDVCKGDGGSPLSCPMPDGHYQQAGIVAWGIGCGEQNVPGVYANVAMFRNWIDRHMIDNGFNTKSYVRQTENFADKYARINKPGK